VLLGVLPALARAIAARGLVAVTLPQAMAASGVAGAGSVLPAAARHGRGGPAPMTALPAAPTQTPDADTAWRALVDRASRPYRRAGRFAWHFARGKLSRDPVFRHLLESGRIAPRAHVVDIGCGQGLLASLLQAAGASAAAGGWPAAWAPAPTGTRVTGIDLMPKDIARADQAFATPPDPAAPKPVFVCGDMRTTPFPPCNAVVVLDVLHYVTIAEQDRVLERIREALSPGGRLVLRIGDESAGLGFAVSQWVDRVVTGIRGHDVAPTFGRPLAAWQERLRALGFAVETLPMHEGTPFANILLVGTLPATAA
jgi:SAM-dependent methyltransferase